MSGFNQQVQDIVARIPTGRVVTYGQLAGWCGKPKAARIVGGIAHYGSSELPWHRVVKKDGSLAEGYPGGVRAHRAHLEAELVTFTDKKVNMERHTWKNA